MKYMRKIILTIINKIRFYEMEYSLRSVIKTLKEKGAYYKCRVCGRKYVQEENGVCKGCKYLVDLKLPKEIKSKKEEKNG